jgi:hypothetical protein
MGSVWNQRPNKAKCYRNVFCIIDLALLAPLVARVRRAEHST